jgi:uncharacterized protein (DUF885 family)
VDAAILRTSLAGELLENDDIREAEWNPMLHNPGSGLHSLLNRDFAPLGERLGAVTERLAGTPAFLQAARTRLGEMSREHVETAVGQLDGTIGLIDGELASALRDATGAPTGVDAAAAAARHALLEHREWLTARVASATRPAPIGEDLFRAKLALTLDTAFEPAALLARAEADLDRLTAAITEQAARIAGGRHSDGITVRDVLDRLAADAPTDDTILPLCRDALTAATAFVRELDLVTVHDDPVVIVAMPEIDRGVAVAYCRQNGPLERAVLPTEFAVSPTPADWTRERVESFYREYNVHMLHNLTVHEAMPGHALQLMHANRHHSDTRVRAVWRSGSFIEGWAVYTEELMADRGFRADESAQAAAGLRMQQLKMQLRSTINAILDIRFHCGDLDKAAALELMTVRGFQEEGEATGKWRRVQLSSTQLCTYYVGYREMHDAAADLRSAQPAWSDRRVHDTMLAHGCPPPRHLRTLLGLAAPGSA